MPSVMTSRQAAEVDHAFERKGLTPKHVKMMCSGDILAKFKDVLDGLAEIKPIEYSIDFDKKPSTPNRWTLLPEREQLQNRVRGKWKFDPTKIKLYLDDSQKSGGYISGNELRKKLANVPVLGAQAVDFYLANPHLIPEEWKGKAVLFWGPIYRGTGGDLCVRCLCWRGDEWCSDYRWLDGDWDDSRPSAVFAS